MNTVFTPINRQMFALITDNADLLIEEEMPKSILEICAHVTSYEPVHQKWEQEDYSEYLGVIRYPEK
ncbi:MAG: hypothetical protein ACYTAO_16290, partial [Planctomycetota bacterium]